MEFKGTKGEWTAYKNCSFWDITTDKYDRSIAFNILLFDEKMNSLSLSSENEANAKLIAAAPELLEACKAFVIALESEEIIMHDNLDHDGFASAPNRIFDNSKKAIEKALK